ncbi:cell division protein ZapD [Ectothiorhodospiraceae bacterium 2226]|nr:cell division protein ZapD [Ectothiorhodospiraceae bacterium 2226]
MRTLMRLEFLFKQATRGLSGEAKEDSRTVIDAMMDILEIVGRSDLKTEFIKELDRQRAALTALAASPAVDTQLLEGILEALERLSARFVGDTAPLGDPLRRHELLNLIRQRSGVPGGTCEFDLPGYHYWLHRPAEQRRADLAAWLAHLGTLREAVGLILKLVRESAVPSRVIAEGGVYQRSLDANEPYQLVRVAVPAECPYYPDISGGKHRFTVRFMLPRQHERPVQAGEDVPFMLSCCAL